MSETNLHHLFYFKRHYREPLQHRFRNTNGLIVEVDVSDHQTLHRQMFYGPPRPTPDQMRAVIDILDAIPGGERTGMWGALAAQAFFEQEAQIQTSARVAERSLRISEHIERQLGFVAVGANELYEIAA